MLPEHNSKGYLPPGIHNAKIEEVLKRFYHPPYKSRSDRTDSLRKFYEFVSKFAIGIYINGSYVTTKLAPSDVDVMVVLPDDYDQNENFRFRLQNFKKYNKDHIDVLPVRITLDVERLKKRLADWGTDLEGNPKGIIYVEIGGQHDQE